MKKILVFFDAYELYVIASGPGLPGDTLCYTCGIYCFDSALVYHGGRPTSAFNS